MITHLELRNGDVLPCEDMLIRELCRENATLEYKTKSECLNISTSTSKLLLLGITSHVLKRTKPKRSLGDISVIHTCRAV